MKTKQAQELYNSLNKSEKLSSIIDTLLSMEDFAEKYLLKNNISSEFKVGDIVCLKKDLEYSQDELKYSFNYCMAKNIIYVISKNNINNVEVEKYKVYKNSNNINCPIYSDTMYDEDEYGKEILLNRNDLVKIDHKHIFKIEYFNFFDNGKMKKTPEIVFSFVDPTGKFKNIKSVNKVEIKNDDCIKNLITRINQLKV